ncbi:MAG: hypothetical protein ABSH53_14660 [Holophaga sp.]|jgi:hypothetical protein
MSGPEVPDMALVTLLSVAKELNLPLDVSLIRSAYAIQRRHQFDRDPQASYQDMKRLVNEFAQAMPSIEGGSVK